MLKKRYKVIAPKEMFGRGEGEHHYTTFAYSPKQAKLMVFMTYIRGASLSFKQVNTLRKSWMKNRRVKVRLHEVYRL